MVYSGSQATPGPGFLLDYDAGSGWIHVGEVKDINGPTESTDEVDVTNQDSTGAFKEFIATLQDGGTVTFDMHLIPDDPGQVDLIDLKHARTIVDWRIVMADTGFNKLFSGFINTFNHSFPVAGVMTGSMGIRVSGPVDQESGS